MSRDCEHCELITCFSFLFLVRFVLLLLKIYKSIVLYGNNLSEKQTYRAEHVNNLPTSYVFGDMHEKQRLSQNVTCGASAFACFFFLSARCLVFYTVQKTLCLLLLVLKHKTASYWPKYARPSVNATIQGQITVPI